MEGKNKYLNLLDGIFPVLPYSCQTWIIIFLVSEGNKIICPHQLRAQPFVDSIVVDVKCSCYMSFDEESSDATKPLADRPPRIISSLN